MNRNVLIAEDDAQLRMALCHVVQREGHAVTEAGDGEDALKKISENKYDLAVIDIIMPRKEGIETILEIRRKRPDLPIIAISGGARFHAFDPLKLAEDCGANFVIEKPFHPSALRDLMRRCLPEA